MTQSGTCLCDCYRQLLTDVSVIRILVAIISYIKMMEKISWKGRNGETRQPAVACSGEIITVILLMSLFYSLYGNYSLT